MDFNRIFKDTVKHKTKQLLLKLWSALCNWRILWQCSWTHSYRHRRKILQVVKISTKSQRE